MAAKKPPKAHLLAVKILEDHKALDIKSIDVRKLTSIADYIIICSGTSTRHVKSLGDNLVDESKKHGIRPLGIEGDNTFEWVLVDLGDALVNIMLPETREFYSLEKLWEINQEKPKRAAKPKTKKPSGVTAKKIKATKPPSTRTRASKPRAVRAKTMTSGETSN